ncbi:MAG: inorganic diphosphatase, partial [Hyphomicrobiales bacterium]
LEPPTQTRFSMRIDMIPVGDNPPESLNVIIEVPTGGEPVKYEFDKDSGALFVDRILHTPMRYPANYGFVPHTLSDDGDPIDVLVAGRVPVVPGAVLRTRPVGVLLMKDEKGHDEKVLGVPVDELSPFYENISSYRDLPRVLIGQIEHFFDHYKDLEEDKWVEIVRWGGAEEALDMIRASIERHDTEQTAGD